MSIATDTEVRRLSALCAELLKRVVALESLQTRIIEGDVPRETSLDVAELSIRFERKFGKPPHHRMLPETMERALRE